MLVVSVLPGMSALSVRVCPIDYVRSVCYVCSVCMGMSQGLCLYCRLCLMCLYGYDHTLCIEYRIRGYIGSAMSVWYSLHTMSIVLDTGLCR